MLGRWLGPARGVRARCPRCGRQEARNPRVLPLPGPGESRCLRAHARPGAARRGRDLPGRGRGLTHRDLRRMRGPGIGFREAKRGGLGGGLGRRLHPQSGLPRGGPRRRRQAPPHSDAASSPQVPPPLRICGHSVLRGTLAWPHFRRSAVSSGTTLLDPRACTLPEPLFPGRPCLRC